MNRKAFLSVIPLVLLVFLVSCQPAAPDTNRPVVTNTNSAPETVDTAAIETALLRIENDWPRVIREKDVEAVRRVEADDIVMVYPDGNIGDKTQDIKDIESGALTAESIEMVDLKVHVLDKDAAFVTGRSIVKKGKFKMPDGKSIDISGQYRFIDSFARRNGEWKLVAGASVPVRQPPPASPTPTPTSSPAASPAAKTSPAATASPRVSPSPRASATP
ncbi:MAG: nuclear transport factor 2 family protein [Acidobacteriota bacterium]